jgi:SCY1-like protein 1
VFPLSSPQIQEQEAKVQFFNNLPAALDLFPPSICKLKILPQLLNAFEYGNAGSSVLAPLFKVTMKLFRNTDSTFQMIYSF